MESLKYENRKTSGRILVSLPTQELLVRVKGGGAFSSTQISPAPRAWELFVEDSP
jgi:hypothetical protein